MGFEMMLSLRTSFCDFCEDLRLFTESLAAETKELSMITMMTIVIQTTKTMIIIFTIREEEQSTSRSNDWIRVQ